MNGFFARMVFVAFLIVAAPFSASAQDATVVSAPPRIQSEADAFAQDAAAYARQNGVDGDEALRRLRAQEDSVAATDGIAREFAGRLAGISIEHFPNYRIAVLLTGDAPVAPRTVRAGGMDVPIVFRTGAGATRAGLVDAIVRHRAAIHDVVPNAQGMGVDLRTGELVVLVQTAFHRDEQSEIEFQLSALSGVPVRIRAQDGVDVDSAATQDAVDGFAVDAVAVVRGAVDAAAVDGGERVVGVDPRDGRRYVCTTGFSVTNDVRTGVVTAAHCPDALTAYDANGNGTPLAFVGQWGVAFQDVQVHVGGVNRPLFHADASTSAARTLTAARSRQSTRAGDAVCHRGQATGYTCSEIDLVDYAPPGDLCAGLCDPVWTTVAGPSCRGGDSGGPIFNGTVAFGITKGGSYARSGRCGFYYYMSTDYLPDGWHLLFDRPPRAPDVEAR